MDNAEITDAEEIRRANEVMSVAASVIEFIDSELDDAGSVASAMMAAVAMYRTRFGYRASEQHLVEGILMMYRSLANLEKSKKNGTDPTVTRLFT